jgi:hypothetical protein
MKRIFHRYLHIPPVILWLIFADLCLQLINAAFTLSLNYYMLDEGYRDFEIPSVVGYRYLTVLLVSLPLALWVKGKRLKPFLAAGMWLSPLVALLLIAAVQYHQLFWIKWLMAAWGVTFTLLQVLVVPYCLANGDKEYETESIALFFQAGIAMTVVVGALNTLLPFVQAEWFTNRNLLILYALLGLVGVYGIHQLPDTEQQTETIPWKQLHAYYDWKRIFIALFPGFLIALGAGFTIPFINLFFHQVHGMDAQAFSLMNAATFTLVVFGGFWIPEVKRRWGYGVAITLIQALGVLVLFILGTTEWIQHSVWGLPVAVAAFVIRQPLMNVAGPMTSELTLNYVGPKNRVLVSALNASIWSGSWFVSAQIFSALRESGVSYANIIFITVAFYSVAVLWYHRLIQRHENEMA